MTSISILNMACRDSSRLQPALLEACVAGYSDTRELPILLEAGSISVKILKKQVDGFG